MIYRERTSYWAVYLFTQRWLIAFLERRYLKQVVPLKKTCIGIDKDLNVDTSYLSNMLKHKPSNGFIQQTYLFRLKISSQEEQE